MWIRQLGLGMFGFTAGIAVATGVFAFILVIGVVPRMIAKTQMADKTRMQETVISISVVTMGFLSVSPWLALYKAPFPSILAQGLLLLYGLGAGIFVGCVAAALAEIVKTHYPNEGCRLLFLFLKWLLLETLSEICSANLPGVWYSFQRNNEKKEGIL